MTAIKCLVLDVDGVLTDGRLFYPDNAGPLRSFHVHDGLAVAWFQRLGGVATILSGKASPAIEARAAHMGVRHVIQGSTDKHADLMCLLSEVRISPEQTAMVADDLIDLPALTVCGYPVAVANAVPEVKAAARYVTQKTGGHGAVREAVEHIMRLTGRWDEVLAHYGVVTGSRA
jgi:3-deoxy-D-manno-octulosonate 8-phosphate phosphatase (KDO 8-P phosphatase)